MEVHLGNDTSCTTGHHGTNCVEGRRIAIGKLEDPSFRILATASRTTCHLKVLVRAKQTSSAIIRRLFVGGKHDRLRGHIDPDCEGLGRKENLEETLAKQDLHDFTKHWEHSGVMLGHALQEKTLEIVVGRKGFQLRIVMEMEAHNMANGSCVRGIH